MITKQHRFHGYNALSYAHKQGKVVRAPQLALKYALNERRKDYRVAVVVSKKVSKSAVVRNRIRRRVYEAFRQAAQDRIEKPYDLIFMVYNESLATMPAGELQKAVADQLRKATVVV